MKYKDSRQRYIDNTTLGDYTFYYSKDEYELLKKVYKFHKPKITEYYCYASDYLKTFIDKLYELRLLMKKEEKEGLSLALKIVMNGLYGKFGQRPEYELAMFGDDDYLQQLIQFGYQDDGGRKYKFAGKIVKNTIEGYKGIKLLPVEPKQKYINVITGAYITSLSRIELLKVIIPNYKSFVYCDTDSVILDTGKYKLKYTPNIDPNKLGAWKDELKGKAGVQFGLLGAKRYILQLEDGSYKVAFSGIGKDRLSSDPFSLFEETEIDNARLQSIRVNGGRVLVQKNVIIKKGNI